MTPLSETLKNQPIIYITRDLDRALGLPLDTEGYFIIANFTPNAKAIAQGHDNVLLIKNLESLNTWQLMEHAEAKNFVNRLAINNERLAILVFKNSRKIELIREKNNWRLLNPSAEMIQKIEGKVAQEIFLPELSPLYPPHNIQVLSSVTNPEASIIQFNHSHTGEGTLLIQSKDQLKALQTKFPKREVRITQFIDGPMFTNNNIVAGDNILIGNISLQLTGLPDYTDNPFATVGNDWGAANIMLNEQQKKEHKKIARQVGQILQTKGWKGLFGIDVKLDEKTGKLYLIEINARQPQSATFESELQRKNTKTQKHESLLTTFEAHLASLLDLNLSGCQIIPISDGRQIIDRRTNVWQRSVESGQNKTLSQPALNLIKTFLNLPLPTPVPCPYFNNRRAGIRGGLRAQVGKGSPAEIGEEARIMARKEKIDLAALNSEQLKKFLIDHNIGIDCSALVFYILDAERKARAHNSLERQLKFPYAKNIFQKLRAKLRPIENTNVQTLAHNVNSKEVSLVEIQPGDLIILLGTGANHDRDHVLVVNEVEQKKTMTLISYTHSFRWSTDGKYNHGVRQGKITITDPDQTLLNQQWTEQDRTGENNETWRRAKEAMALRIRRLKSLE